MRFPRFLGPALLPAVAPVVLLAGCDDPPAAPAPEADPVPRTWVAGFAGAGGDGTLVADVVQRGETVKGRVAYRIAATGERQGLDVRGTYDGDRLHLELDPERIPYAFTFTVDADVRTDGGLTGTVALSSHSLVADLDGRVVERGRGIAGNGSSVGRTVKALVFDGQYLWVSTPADDYGVMDPGRRFVGVVTVYYRPGTRWTSGALTFDGTNLRGFLPVTTIGPGGIVPTATFIEFTPDGTVAGESDLDHRPEGLAYDGAAFWSLEGRAGELHRFDASGTVIGTVPLEIPDAVYLEFDGRDLWTVGWIVRKLYRLDVQGRCLAAYDLPPVPEERSPGGLAFDGTWFWIAETDPLIQRTSLLQVRPGS